MPSTAWNNLVLSLNTANTQWLLLSPSLLRLCVAGMVHAAPGTTEPSITRPYCSPANRAIFSFTSLRFALYCREQIAMKCALWFQHPCAPWGRGLTHKLSSSCSVRSTGNAPCSDLSCLLLPPSARPCPTLRLGAFSSHAWLLLTPQNTWQG